MTTVGKTKGRRRRGRKEKPWCDQEILDAIRERKKLCRALRKAVKNKTECKEEKAAYEIQQMKTKRLISQKLEQYYRRIEEEVRESGRQNGQKFWKYIESMTTPKKAKTSEIALRDNQGGNREKLIRKDDIEKHMTRYFNQQQEELRKRTCASKPCTLKPHENKLSHSEQEDILRAIEEEELTKHLNKLKKGKATGPDGIPNEFLKVLGPRSKENLRRIFNNILESKEIPEEWNHSSVRLLYKDQGKPKDDLKSYRPITLQSNIAKLFSTIINDRITKTYDQHLTEAQNGFREDRSGSDNLFIITQLIELSLQSGQELYVAFLDLEKAYDAVPHEVRTKYVLKLL
ncbi:uncharacterized protein LOC135389635 [Ornithodoros turicata]|uniref:uncharacterized protein LOC135389635 n=1 Tax=Ornithodoros turicata TaxID=34597 RepID=UPI003138918F